jgi:hypothetical protein
MVLQSFPLKDLACCCVLVVRSARHLEEVLCAQGKTKKIRVLHSSAKAYAKHV